MNRGFRIQYSSALGPYEGGLHFGGGMSSDVCKVSVLGCGTIVFELTCFVVTRNWHGVQEYLHAHAIV